MNLRYLGSIDNCILGCLTFSTALAETVKKKTFFSFEEIGPVFEETQRLLYFKVPLGDKGLIIEITKLLRLITAIIMCQVSTSMPTIQQV
jgi:hypothetical protein